MRLRLLLVALALLVMAAACSYPSYKPGPDGIPPLAANDAWARQQVEVILLLYPFTPAAQTVIRKLDMRHLQGRPGWFGSTGFQRWLGIGAAKPMAIVHEISHSLWGAFPIEGRPELSWDAPVGQTAPGLQALNKDLETFLQQPPDTFEPLRAYFRQLPDLVSGQDPALYHGGQADLVYLTAGDIRLIPPPLRKYYAPFLGQGDFATWQQALAWYRGLAPLDRTFADQYLGFGRLPLVAYPVDTDADAKVPSAKAALIQNEYRQRLTDFAADYPRYFEAIGEPPIRQQFHFWRDYLRDTQSLYRPYFDVFNRPGHTAAQLRVAFTFLQEAGLRTGEERTAYVSVHLLDNRDLFDFAPTLDHATLAALLEPTSTASRKEKALATRLRLSLHPVHVAVLDEMALLGRLDAVGAQQEFNAFALGLQARGITDVNFALDIFTAVDPILSHSLLAGMSKEAARALLAKDPSFLRSLVQPEELIAALGYGGTLDAAQLIELAKLLTAKLPADPLAAAPYLEALYRRLIQLSPQAALDVFASSGLYLEPFLVQHPAEAAGILGADPARAVQLLPTVNPVRLPAARVIYRLIRADPAVAAALTAALDASGANAAVLDTLAYVAFDADSTLLAPGQAFSLQRDGLYLAALLQLRGSDWLTRSLTAAVQRYRNLVIQGEEDATFLAAYQKTLTTAASTILADIPRQQISLAVAAAFRS